MIYTENFCYIPMLKYTGLYLIGSVMLCCVLTLIGSGILVRTVLEEGATGVNMYFPGGGNAVWYDAETYRTFPGASKVCDDELL